MKNFWAILLSGILFALPVLLYIADEHLLGQVLLFSQLIILWGLLPFLFRREQEASKEWSRKALGLCFILVAAMTAPFLLRLVEKTSLQSTDILQSSASLFSEASEVLLVLGACLATFFVIAVLLKRRGSEA